MAIFILINSLELMGLFDFWKVKTDFSNLLLKHEKVSANKLFEIIFQIRELLENPIDYDAQNNWNIEGYVQQEVSKIKLDELYNKYTDDQFSRHIKFQLGEGMSKDKKGNYNTFEEQLENLGREIFSHSMQRANVKIDFQNLDVVRLLITKNTEALNNLSKYSNFIENTIKTLVHFCSIKATILDKDLTVNDVQEAVLIIVIKNTQRLADFN